jgi:Putative Ig domain
MLDIWTQRSGYNLGTYEERTQLSIPLPVLILDPISFPYNFKFNLISGKLPPGLRIQGASIIGTPLEVAKRTDFEFCIRASKDNEISDRTYIITIEGADQPIIINPEGLLPVGPNETYFILDSSPVEFQITAIDSDTATGQRLRYFINPGDGALPPGLTMDENGLITGFIQPLLSLALSDRNGNFDKTLYDRNGFDYGLKPDNGFDSFKFDTINFDYSLPSIGVKKLNRNYEFILTVSDGDTLVKRKFRIYVVNEDFLRADNTIMSAGNSTYTAANSGVRTPIWFTKPNLGVLRANNYHIIKLDVYDAIELGVIQYTLEAANPDSSASQLPPGLQLDPTNGELFGIVPNQSEIEETYHFTINASRYGRKGEVASSVRTFSVKILGEINSQMSWISPENLGAIDANYISTLKVQAASKLLNADVSYQLVYGQLPPGLSLDRNGEIVGKVEQYGNGSDIKGMTTFDSNEFSLDGDSTSIDRRFEFVVRAQDQANYSKIDKKFVLSINTPNDRLYSNIYIKAYMEPFKPTPTTSKRSLFNKFINDQSVFTKEYIYRLNDSNFGVRKDLKAVMYAGIETKIAATYISAIGLNHKKKRFLFGDVKIAQAKTPGTMNNVYEIVYVQLIDELELDNKKLKPKLKLPKSSTTLTVDASNKEWDASYNTVNEPFAPWPKDIITVDQTSILSSDPNGIVRYLNTYTNWRERLRFWKKTDPLNPSVIVDQFITERNYLPLWMRSFQDNTRQELGFVLALPLCYCLPGYAEEIVLNIKNYQEITGFDFKDLDFTVDRYIIDSVKPLEGEQNYGDKYLVFKNNGITL